MSRSDTTTDDINVEVDRRAEVKGFGYNIFRALPFLLQKAMSLYGSMSAGCPLHVASESLRILHLEDRNLTI